MDAALNNRIESLPYHPYLWRLVTGYHRIRLWILSKIGRIPNDIDDVIEEDYDDNSDDSDTKYCIKDYPSDSSLEKKEKPIRAEYLSLKGDLFRINVLRVIKRRLQVQGFERLEACTKEGLSDGLLKCLKDRMGKERDLAADCLRLLALELRAEGSSIFQDKIYPELTPLLTGISTHYKTRAVCATTLATWCYLCSSDLQKCKELSTILEDMFSRGCGQGDNSLATSAQGDNSPVNSGQGNNSPVSSEQGNNSPVSSGQGSNSPVNSGQGNNSPVSSEQGNNSPVSSGQGNNSPVSSGQGDNSQNEISQQNWLMFHVLKAWCLLLTSCTQDDIQAHINKHMGSLMELLKSSDEELRVTAGEVIVLLYEMARGAKEEFREEGNEAKLCQQLKQLACDSVSHRAKTSRRRQKASFRDVYRNVVSAMLEVAAFRAKTNVCAITGRECQHHLSSLEADA
ncbi:interferon-related developmental regulator 2-like isoform X2 [Physella acuta]|uniref:interferon-related developmental regulator 2-like isoform X2 n=1 Tax=Physella acuta TaxID=109671 RepID=UPI0027DE6882|nr:interferon-related developmental regulator 2-like isoform X2 [Physella acuta]